MLDSAIQGQHRVEARGAPPAHRAVLHDVGLRQRAPPARALKRHVTSRNLFKNRQNVVRFRLYRHRSFQVDTRFAAFFKIYQIFKLTFLKVGKICKFYDFCKNFAEFSLELLLFQSDFLRKI